MAKSRSPLIQRFLWRLEALCFDLFTAIARAMPIEPWSAFGGALFKALGPLTRAHRTARRSLKLALPDLSEPETAAILAAQWENFGRYIAEFPVLDRLTPSGGRVDIGEAGRLQEIAATGQPVVFISGHLSNMEVMAAAIVDAGIPCEVTYRAANNPHVDARIKTSRFRYGVRMFAPKGTEGGRELIEGLKAGRSIAMMNDQRYDAGVAAPFFGRPVMTNPAAVRLALRVEIQNCPVPARGESGRPRRRRRPCGRARACTTRAPHVNPHARTRVPPSTRGHSLRRPPTHPHPLGQHYQARTRHAPGTRLVPASHNPRTAPPLAARVSSVWV